MFRTNIILAGAFFPIATVVLRSEAGSLTTLLQNNNISSALVSMTLSIGFAFIAYQSASDAINNAIPLDELSDLVDQSVEDWEYIDAETPNRKLNGYGEIYSKTFKQTQKQVKETRWYTSASMFFLYTSAPLLGIRTLDSIFGTPDWILGLVLLPLIFAMFTAFYLYYWRSEKDIVEILSS